MIFYIVLQRFTTFLPLFCPFLKQKTLVAASVFRKW
nr:MAG TPA: hypothetical protein [Caudoviricetes sp.]